MFSYFFFLLSIQTIIGMDSSKIILTDSGGPPIVNRRGKLKLAVCVASKLLPFGGTKADGCGATGDQLASGDMAQTASLRYPLFHSGSF
jgi:hypothetical protein